MLCETQEGCRNLVDLVSKGLLECFFYKPRIDKDLLRAALQRPDRHVRLLARRPGEVECR